MAAIEKGRICWLSRGRNAGKKVAVLETGKGSVVTVIRDGKKEKCNIRHLFPTKEKAEAGMLKETRKKNPEKAEKKEQKKGK